ncbi:ATP-binding cassette domain-containing protein [Taklimakanibacter deserti]|uniref:ATP-binding cassette domain-containing protein n=1 Tax=Taklimakanibacter deserti TaxID=2267839 RepID=UPI000E648518
MSEPVVRIDNVSKVFHQAGLFNRGPGFTAVSNVSLAVTKNSTLGIVGESGSGKSTLLRMVLRLISPSAGRIFINGADIWALRGKSLKAMRREVQPIFQNPASSFNPRHTIRAILLAPLEVHGIGTAAERRERIHTLLRRVGLDPAIETRLPHQLSGGQKQRIAIARAVILGPSLVLADEPTSALDVSVQAQVLKLFSDIKYDFGLTTIFVSHNLAVIREVSDEVAVMRQGEVVEQGTVDQIFDDPQHPYTRELLAAVPVPEIMRNKEREPQS